MHPMLNITIRAARKAGNFIAKNYEKPDTFEANHKSKNDFLIQVNHEAERLIIEIIRKYYPQHTVISQKYGALLGTTHDIQWIIHSMDGIDNFINRIPHIAVSIAVRVKSHTEVAVVYDPIRNELFSATRGQGSQMNGYRLRCGIMKDLENTILAINFPLKQKQHFMNYMTLLSKLFVQSVDFRCTGSAALDLAYIAAGRVDGCFQIGLKQWDVTSGELLVREAGGLVTDFTGENNHLLSGNVVAGNPRVVKSMLNP
ncbi:inositol-1-monophosphatase [Candidatus Palibaumannia cicadellinicola]|uniref:Inositol-1-monophosphatase n=1 Tax=Candidatus Palibaumannia cicadellinicola TaxID=186490 RepID=A0A088N0P3_9GAMM|nr:inositol-1-monophosphatase [Candidatus Baumannia cicadellinicola]AIN46891.1 Inositol-1-monophosphatase [Candidatus Baumannia cicadellinicola]